MLFGTKKVTVVRAAQSYFLITRKAYFPTMLVLPFGATPSTVRR